MKRVNLLYLWVILVSGIAIAQVNPVPFVQEPVVPTSVSPGGPSFTLTVNGAGFVSGSVVKWNGAALATVFVGGSQLRATVPAANIASVGTATVTVFSPGPGGGTSNYALLNISDPNPTDSMVFTPSGFGVFTDYVPSIVAAGDFNHDGKLDVAFGGGQQLDAGAVTVALGDGYGAFQTTKDNLVEFNPEHMIGADFNGDGNLDLAVTNTGNQHFPDATVSVLLGNGDGTFMPSTPYATSPDPVFVVAGDFNRDGHLDLVTAASGISILMGNGDGTFQSHVDYEPTDSVLGLAMGDFNGDGNLDLVADPVGFIAGNGDGTFQPPVPIPPPPGTYDTTVAADLNGDGKLDLVTNGAGVCVRLGNGDGTFQTPVCYDTADASSDVTVGDFNADGKMDLAFTKQTDSSHWVLIILLGNGDGTFQNGLDFPYIVGGGVGAISAGDFNGDGKMDLAVTGGNPYSTVMSVLFQGPFPAVGFNPSGVTYGPQAPGTGSAPKIVVLKNTGTGTLTISRISIIGANAGDFAQTNNCGSSVAAGSSCQISITFTPQAAGDRSAALNIEDNARPSPQSVGLGGSGNDFSLTATPTDLTVTPGQAANYSLTTTPMSGFSGTVAFTCSGAPPQSTCTVTPNKVTLDGSSSATADVAVVTSGSSMGFTRPPGSPRGTEGFVAWLSLCGAPGLAMLFILAGPRSVHRPRLVLYGMALVAIVIAMPGCGGGGAGSVTTKGTYEMTVTGSFTAGSVRLVHSVNVTVAVQ